MMKKWAVSYLAMMVGVSFAGPVSAGSLNISPYPKIEAPAPAATISEAPTVSEEGSDSVLMPELDAVDAVELEVSAPSAQPKVQPVVPTFAQDEALPFSVPQPGDSYFEAPPEDMLLEAMTDTQPVQKEDDAVVPDVPEAPMVTFITHTSQPVENNEPVNMLPQEPLQQRAQQQPEVQPETNLRLRMSGASNEVIVEKLPVASAPAYEPERVVPERTEWFGQEDSASGGNVPAPIHVSATFQEARWTAQKGEKIQDVLENWGREKGVQLLWNTAAPFHVRKTLAVPGGFEQAVEALLDQYKTDQQRPLATLHMDPETGEKIMVVRSQDGV